MTIWPGAGMNFQNNINTSLAQYNADVISAELDYLISVGINRVRLVSNLEYPAGVTNIRNAALLAKGKGMSVLFGATQITPTLTAANWATYAAAIEAEAVWAQANSMDEFSIGNELEFYNDGTTLTDAQVRANVRTLSTTIQGVFTIGDVSYSLSQGTQNSLWQTDNNKGSCDKLMINVYGQTDAGGGIASFYTELNGFLRVYPNGEISEWNVDPTHLDIMALSNYEQLCELQKRFDYIRQKVSKAYFFTWRWGGANDDFALRRANGEIRNWTQVVVNDYRSWCI